MNIFNAPYLGVKSIVHPFTPSNRPSRPFAEGLDLSVSTPVTINEPPAPMTNRDRTNRVCDVLFIKDLTVGRNMPTAPGKVKSAPIVDIPADACEIEVTSGLNVVKGLHPLVLCFAIAAVCITFVVIAPKARWVRYGPFEVHFKDSQEAE